MERSSPQLESQVLGAHLVYSSLKDSFLLDRKCIITNTITIFILPLRFRHYKMSTAIIHSSRKINRQITTERKSKGLGEVKVKTTSNNRISQSVENNSYVYIRVISAIIGYRILRRLTKL